MKKLMIFFSAGCMGALANSLVVWQFGEQGISAMLGVAIAPSLSPAWLYPRLIWGGLWGMLFILPIFSSRIFLKAAILSLLPTAVQLFVVFPFKAAKGMAGLELGLLTPMLVIFYNYIWAMVAAISIKLARAALKNTLYQ